MIRGINTRIIYTRDYTVNIIYTRDYTVKIILISTIVTNQSTITMISALLANESIEHNYSIRSI